MDLLVYQAAFQNSPSPCLILERRGPGELYVMDVNAVARKSILGRSDRAGDVVGRDISDVAPGLRATGQLDTCELALDGQQPIDLGDLAYEAAGAAPSVISARAIPLDASALLIRGERAAPRVRDLAGAERELQRYRSMIAASSDLTAFVDSTYTYQAVNRAYCDELERTEREILGHTVAEVLGQEAFETTLKSRFDRCLAGEQMAFEFWWNSPSRGRRHIDERYNPFLEPDGSVSGVVVDARDTTDQKQVEQLLERSVAALEVANRELEAFSDSLAHDLRNPLLTVTQFSEYLNEALGDTLDEQLGDYLSRIRAAGRHMTHIIEDLRDLTDVKRGEVSQERVDLSSMGREIIDDLSALVPSRRVTFVAEPGITALGDKTLLRLLLTNLLQNAWKYTGPNEDARIELGTELDERDVPTYHVRDNGIGFDNADRGRIFGAFERLHTEHEFAGSGLGLATVDRIVRRHGGRVWADGTPGEGAVFRFTLASGAVADVQAEVVDKRSFDR